MSLMDVTKYTKQDRALLTNVPTAQEIVSPDTFPEGCKGVLF